uniref:Ethylene receptor n=1 Tax=Anthurium amnicola TaxID=1678845 RepID=A0A1D1YUD1_9ARAE
MQMSRTLCHWLLVLSLFVSVVAVDIEFPHCSCHGEGLWSVERILQFQKVGDFLIATAYFSIPLELLYFVTCSNVFPFKWVLFQFVAFIVLCGLSHLLTVFTYEPHSFHLMLALTISKFLTALVSFATAITLLTLIPQLLTVKVRENFLRIKARELDREVGMMKRQEEARWHVRMLTQEIRKSLDRHTILYTTLVELSQTLGLQNCAVWMPNEGKTEMNLTHELRQRSTTDVHRISVPMDNPDIMEIKKTNGTKLLRQDSLLASASSGGVYEHGAVAAIRMPLLKVSDFKGGTPEVTETCYVVLVLVLPKDVHRDWIDQELEIVEVVADQVAVALSHAAVLEESQMMRKKLAEQNRALQQAKMNAVMASKARNSFQNVMSRGMRRPIHSIFGLSSMLQQETLCPEQRLIFDTMMKTSAVVSALINDIVESPDSDTKSLTLEMRPFQLHAMIKEAASIARCLCDSKGFGFGIQIENAVPNLVVGDEKRTFQVILHMVGNFLNEWDEGFITFRVLCESGIDDKPDQRWIPWKAIVSDGYADIKFEIGIKKTQSDGPSSSGHIPRRPKSGRVDLSLSFGMCKKLVQLMQGNIFAVSNSQGLADSMILLLRFQLQLTGKFSEPGGSLGHSRPPSSSLFKGLRVLLADDDDVNRAVTQKLLEKLGCLVSPVSSGHQCLSSLGASNTPFDLVLLDIHMHDMDGFHVAIRIRKFKSGNWPLIVALTASSQEDVWERCLQSGMHGLIQKPVMLQGMADELCRVLHNT